MSAAGRDRTRVLLYGCLWAVAVVAFWAVDFPMSQMKPRQVAVLLASGLPQAAVGTCIAAYGQFAARHLGRVGTLAGALLGAPLIIALHVSVLRGFTIPLFDMDLLIDAERLLPTHVAYAAWEVVVLGGVLLTACVWTEQAARTRTLLAQAEIARGLAATQLGEAQLQALQTDIDPAFLQRVLAQVKRIYPKQPADADHLLDQLVAFLRAAMPAVRTGRSTLVEELHLAAQVAELHNQLGDGGPSRTVEVSGTPPDDLPLPPLLRLIGRLTDATPRGSAVRLVAHCGEGGVTLALHAAGAGPWLDGELEYRLRVGLRSIYGAHATVQVPERPGTGAIALMIALPAASFFTAPSPAHPTAQPEGGPRWTIPATT